MKRISEPFAANTRDGEEDEKGGGGGLTSFDEREVLNFASFPSFAVSFAAHRPESGKLLAI